MDDPGLGSSSKTLVERFRCAKPQKTSVRDEVDDEPCSRPAVPTPLMGVELPVGRQAHCAAQVRRTGRRRLGQATLHEAAQYAEFYQRAGRRPDPVAYCALRAISPAISAPRPA